MSARTATNLFWIGVIALIGWSVAFPSADRQAFKPAPEPPPYLVIHIEGQGVDCTYHLSRENARKVATMRIMLIEVCPPDSGGIYKVELKP